MQLPVFLWNRFVFVIISGRKIICNTTWKESKFGVFLVRILSYLDKYRDLFLWISIFAPIQKKNNNKDKKPRIILVPSDQQNSPTLSKSRFQKKSKLNLGQILTKTNSKKLNFLLKMNLRFFSSFLLSFYLHVLWGLYICTFYPRFFQLLLL